MIKFLLKIAIPIIIGLLIYNYFFGTQEERKHPKVVFNKTKDLTVSVYDLLKAEKNKFDEGKYDKAMDKLNDVYDAVKNNGDNYTDAQKSEFKELEAEKEKASE
jgi:hypothetical protein